MRRLTLALLAATYAVALTGCAQYRADLVVTTKVVQTPRGAITCVVNTQDGGVDCDWEHPQ